MQEENKPIGPPVDVTGDGGVMKEIIQEGISEDFAQLEQEVDITFIGTLEDGTEFVKEDNVDEPFQIFLGIKYLKTHISFFS